MKDNYGNRPGVNEGERQHLSFLETEVTRMKSMFKEKGKTKSTNSDGDSSSGSESEGEFVDELPVMIAKAQGGPRMSVSAEVFGKFNIE